ncbi:MAG TPA: RodZ domain-containing protein [Aliidongia sp.]|nr:RodZ domain-containing protein [Aliidongia sp.]
MATFKQRLRNRAQGGELAAEAAGIDPDEPVRDTSAGGLLRQTREDLGWDIRDVGAALRIRADYLEALERNTVTGLPGPTYASGFLRAYAEYLGLDGAELVRRFRTEKTGLHAKAELAFPVPLTDRGIPGGGLFLIAVLLCGLGYGTWYYISSGKHVAPAAVEPVPARLQEPPPTIEPPTLRTPAPTAPTAAPPAEVASSTPAPAATPAPTPAPQGATIVPPSPATTPAPASAAPDAADPNAPKPDQHVFGNPDAHGRVMIRALANAWVTVKDGEKLVLNRLLKKGDVYYPEKDTLTMRAGNSGALQFTVDGKVLPPQGEIGQVKTLSLRPERLLAPPPASPPAAASPTPSPSAPPAQSPTAPPAQ